MHLVVSSSAKTFQASALSYVTGCPLLDIRTPAGRYTYPCHIQQMNSTPKMQKAWLTSCQDLSCLSKEGSTQCCTNEIDKDVIVMLLLNIFYHAQVLASSLSGLTCCKTWVKSLQAVLRPFSSRVFSHDKSCNAPDVVSSISKPAWFAKVNSGNPCCSHIANIF